MKRLYFSFLLILVFLGSTIGNQANGQSIENAKSYLLNSQEAKGVETNDLGDFLVSSQYTAAQTGITHLYFQQSFQGVEIRNAITGVHIDSDGALVHIGENLISGVSRKINVTKAALSPEQALYSTAVKLGYKITTPFAELNAPNNGSFLFSDGGFADAPISSKLVYVYHENALFLAYEMEIKIKEGDHLWNVRADAISGEILGKDDMVIHCNFGKPNGKVCEHPEHDHYLPAPFLKSAPKKMGMVNTYNVFAQPVESPNHGVRSIVTAPFNSTASPFGWHDTDGSAGAEFTITRGNNTHAYQDQNDTDGSLGDEPDGGPNLDFDFPMDLTTNSPYSYTDAAVVNLFYWMNMMHDVWYNYGFDEAAGNFQENNYGNGGAGSDYIYAEAQDGSGTDNANYQGGADGQNGRIQMYLWGTGGGSGVNFTVDAPATIAGGYAVQQGGFGGAITTTISEDLVFVSDATADSTQGCNTLVNGSELTGKIAMIDRGACEFGTKCLNAENAGAIVAIVCNSNPGEGLIDMGPGVDGGFVTIPCFFMSYEDCQTIRVEMPGATATFQAATGPNGLDGDLDNGIISHEYGHGISNRLTGGPNTGGCLNNDEQMGEGWSDWFALVMTSEAGDQGTDIRGMGTYAIGQPTNGPGIRTYAYSTNMGINPHTYNDIGNESIPHGVGSVWCAMIWDMYWALREEHGYDSDIFGGTGGNNKAMHLVMEGMKLQPCNPGFVDGRDAIIAANAALYNGEDECLIWSVFANRGLGFSASQGSSASANDAFQAFDIPPSCQVATVAPSADFIAETTENCSGIIAFEDLSVNIPQQWFWEFGDGNTSTEENPVHTYQNPGMYTVTLTVTNTIGNDNELKTDYINIIDVAEPIVENVNLCEAGSAIVYGDAGGEISWYNANGALMGTGNPLVTPTISTSTTIFAQNAIVYPSANVGILNSSIGGGGYHDNTSTQYLEFEVFQDIVLVSAWVDANSAGTRNIQLWDGTGTLIQNYAMNIAAGQDRIDLNIPLAPGTYRIGGTEMDLFRNNAGTNYPYIANQLVEITGSSAGEDYYYYLYDWEVQQPSCESDLVPFDVTVVAGNAPDPSINFTQNDFEFNFTNSASANFWFWDFGDGNTSTDQNPIHTYAGSGDYVVTLVVSNDDCQLSSTTTVSAGLTGVNTLIEVDVVEIQPNFGTGVFDLNIDLAEAQKVSLKVYGATGQLISNEDLGTLNQFTGSKMIASGTAGTYFIVLEIGDQLVHKKYVLIP